MRGHDWGSSRGQTVRLRADHHGRERLHVPRHLVHGRKAHREPLCRTQLRHRYLGLWTSNIDYGPVGPWEQDVYLGIRPVTGPINWDIAAYYYLYGNRDSGQFGSSSDIDYYEFKISASTTPVTNMTVGATVWLTPDQGYAATDNISYEGTISYDLPKLGIFSPTISGLVGHSESGTNVYYPTGYWVGEDSYTYWNAGMKLAVDKFFMDFRYWDTTLDDGLADSRFVFSAGVNLLP